MIVRFEDTLGAMGVDAVGGSAVGGVGGSGRVATRGGSLDRSGRTSSLGSLPLGNALYG